jgi:hypothetical protein
VSLTAAFLIVLLFAAVFDSVATFLFVMMVILTIHIENEACGEKMNAQWTFSGETITQTCVSVPEPVELEIE